MKVSLLSKYRSCLMALAMLWVAYRHSNFPSIWKPFGFVLYACGYGGVDAFLFLSGFGIYYACKKEKSYWHYLKRRLLRVLPYSVLAMMMLFAFGRKTFIHAIIEGFGLSIWFRSDWIQWYTSFLILIYAVAPLYYKIFKKSPCIVSLVAIFVTTAICYQLDYRNFYIFFRTVIFLIGFGFGYMNDVNPDQNVWWTLIVMVFGWWLQYYMLHNYGSDILHTQPFPFIIPGFMLLAAYFVDKISFIRKPLMWLSTYSYQFYLIHEEILGYIYSYYGVLYRPGIYFDWLINIAGFAIALLVGILLKKSVDCIIARIIDERIV